MDLIIYLLIGLVLGIAVMVFVLKQKMGEIAKLAPENEDEKTKKPNIK